MSNLFDGFSATTTFPDHDPCFGMTQLINLPHSFARDDQLFEYSSPIISRQLLQQTTTYFTSLVSAILVLYSPEDVESSFFAQLLNVYSLIVAAMIAIARRNLTNLYLLAYLARSLFHKHTRLDRVFGEGKHLNRIIVIVMFPLWLGVLSFVAMPTSTWEFQQAACDSTGRSIFIAMGNGYLSTAKDYLGKAQQTPSLWSALLHRRKVSNRYPFIQFCTVIVLPHFIWIFNIEIGLHIVSTRESFSATYGQLLAIFVTIPSFIQLCVLLPRVPRWFWDLTWVRLLTCRRNAPRRTDRPDDFSGLVQDGIMMQKYDPGALHSAETSEYTVSSTLNSAPGY
ncbi:hypothetical protein B0H13DRAFT_2448749 [Mycena leptocephala]|nr:hypothetical protein B0H13DRAFT_2448749 [Mycena leptocephala]